MFGPGAWSGLFALRTWAWLGWAGLGCKSLAGQINMYQQLVRWWERAQSLQSTGWKALVGWVGLWYIQSPTAPTGEATPQKGGDRRERELARVG